MNSYPNSEVCWNGPGPNTFNIKGLNSGQACYSECNSRVGSGVAQWDNQKNCWCGPYQGNTGYKPVNKSVGARVYSAVALNKGGAGCTNPFPPSKMAEYFTHTSGHMKPWEWVIIVVVALLILWCLWYLLAKRKRRY